MGDDGVLAMLRDGHASVLVRGAGCPNRRVSGVQTPPTQATRTYRKSGAEEEEAGSKE